MKTSEVRMGFKQAFPNEPDVEVVVFAPGRVNLIGDHIDYAGGTVLPMPIQYGTYIAAGPSGSDSERRTIKARSHNFKDHCEIDLESLQDPGFLTGDWRKFVFGAAKILAEKKGSLTGMNLYVFGDIPSGGLSSSASFSISLLSAMARHWNLNFDELELSRLAQRIEHDYIGLNCGLMDQAVIELGEPDCALAFDCSTDFARSIKLDLKDCSILVVDSGVPRRLAASAYNTRRAELATFANDNGLEESSLAKNLNEALVKDATSVHARRARHVFTEEQRTIAGIKAIEACDWNRFGQLLNESHYSLRDDYEVSCDEVDALSSILRESEGCFGARMTGAGFGGAVVALVAPNYLEKYAAAVNLEARTLEVHSPGGVKIYD